MQQQQAALPDYFHPTSTYFHYFRQRPKSAAAESSMVGSA